mgnify:FL=1
MNNSPLQIDINNIEFIESKFVEINGLKISYREAGEGDILFCIPPWPSGSAAFIPLSNSLKESLRVVSIDLPGWAGHSEKLNVEPNLENYAYLIEEFIKSFSSKKFYILGYSFGGALTQLIIERGNVKPDKVILVSTLHSGNEINTEQYKYIRFYKNIERLNIPYTVKKYLFAFFFMGRRVLGSSYYKKYLNTQYYNLLVKEGLQADINTIFKTLLSLFHIELLDPQESDYKYLIIYAEYDPDFIKSETIEMAQYLKVKPFVIKEANHDHFTFDINKSSKVIYDFLHEKESLWDSIKQMSHLF